MDIKDILNPSLGSLEWDALEPLFHWDEALLYGDEEQAIATASQGREVRETGDWTYRRRRNSSEDDDSYPSRDLDDSGQTVSKYSNDYFLRQLDAPREKLNERGRYDSNPPGFEAALVNPADTASFARPGRVGLQMAQWFPAKNPYLEQFPIPMGTPPEPTDEHHLNGARWVFSTLEETLLGFKLMLDDILQAIGLEAACDVFVAQLSHHVMADRLAAVLHTLQESDLANIQRLCGVKRDRLLAVVEKLRECWRIPFMTLDGKVDKSITLIQIATASVAIDQCWERHQQVSGFRAGAEQAFRLITQKG